jgi:hypothetical protein
MALSYRLIKFHDLAISRQAQGTYVNGDWVEGSATTFTVKAKVQPLRDTQLMLMPESDRNTSWLVVFVQEVSGLTVPALRAAQQGSGGWDADEFSWQGYRYRVMKDNNHAQTNIDHTRVMCARIEVTPN